MASETAALIPVLTNPTYHLKRVGLEAGPLSQWLFRGLSVTRSPGLKNEEAFMSADLDPREARLNELHVRPLMELVHKLRKRFADIAETNGDLDPPGVPNVDPTDGGVNARALFFLATPGRRAVGSGFVSQDNPDDTALNMRKALAEAGFRRPDVVLWNVVPYCVSTKYQDRKVSDAQVRKAVPDSQAFVDELLKSRRLKVVVFCGLKAQLAGSFLRVAPAIPLSTFHTGAQSFNHKRCRDDIDKTFKKAFELISK